MTIRDVIERHGHFAHGGNPDDTAETRFANRQDAGRRLAERLLSLAAFLRCGTVVPRLLTGLR
jgi:hypothetical protein